MAFKKSVKAAALLLAAVVVFFASCRGKSQTAEGRDIFERMRNTTYEVKLLFPGFDPQADKDMVVKAFNDKLTELGYPGLSIRLDGMDWGSWGERGNAIVLSGGDYDLVYAANWSTFYNEAMSGGAWTTWDAYLNEFPEFERLIAPWRESLYEWGTDPNEKHIYRMPCIKEYASILCEARWNKTVADKLGITEGLRNIKTVYDLGPYLEMYKNAYGNKGMAVLADATGSLVNCFRLGSSIVGSSIFQPAYDYVTDRYETSVFSPWFDEYVALRRDWRAKGYIPDYEQTEAWDDLIRKFGPESFLVYFNVGKPGGEAEMNVSAPQVLGFEWGMTFLTAAVIDAGSLMANSFAINARTGNAEAAAFMHMLLNTNKELTNLINFGIEGVHYTLNDKGILVKSEPSRYYTNLMWMLGNRFLCHSLPGEPENLGQIYDDFNRGAIIFNNFGFSEPRVNDWASGGVDIDLFRGVAAALATQYDLSIWTGNISDADIADIRNRLNQANRSGVEAVYNREYEAWRAAK
jgi:putative aldouronate transport system substrate-binding protein